AIRDVTVLPDDRSNILVKGVLRYRIVEYVEDGKPYLTARLECFEDPQENKDAAKNNAAKVIVLFDLLARAAFKLSRERRPYEITAEDDPERLSFRVMTAFNLETQLKYDLAKTTDTSDRLSKLRDILAAVAPNLEEQSDLMEVSQTNGHSKKHI